MIFQMQNQRVVFVVIFTFLLVIVQCSSSPYKLRTFLALAKTEGSERVPETRTVRIQGAPADLPARNHPHTDDIQNGYRPVLEEPFFIYPKRAPAGRRVCGKQLTSLLSLVCNGRYNTGGRKRRSAPTKDMQIDDLASRNGSQVKRNRYPEEDRANEGAGSVEPADMVRMSMQRRSNTIFLHRRQDDGEDETTGAYTECCLKPCAVKDMIGYCHPDVQKTKYGVGS